MRPRKLHWTIPGPFIKEYHYQKLHNTGFPVKLCPECNKAWEMNHKEPMIHLDFPKRGLRPKICPFCKDE